MRRAFIYESKLEGRWPLALIPQKQKETHEAENGLWPLTLPHQKYIRKHHFEFAKAFLPHIPLNFEVKLGTAITIRVHLNN